MCSPSSEQLGGLGLSSPRLMALRPDSVSCSATLMCGELFVGEEDGGREESAAPIEELGADSARGDSPGHDALSTESVGHEFGALEDMRPTDEVGCASDGDAVISLSEPKWLRISIKKRS